MWRAKEVQMEVSQALSAPQTVDLFAGCGGMSLGFETAGYQILAAFDNWKPAIEVYKSNFKHKIYAQDLSDINESIKIISDYNPELIIGGPPCQDFSTAGRKDENRGRATLSIKYAQIVSAIKPKWFVMENVSTVRKTKTFQTTLEIFRSAGYGLTESVLDASYCGVPQTRKRMFVIGGLSEEDGFLTENLRAQLSETPMTIRDHLGSRLEIEHYFRVPTNYSRRGVFSVDEPSMTIRGVERPIPPGYLGHPNDSAPLDKVRPLTVKERSLIQTFPEDFKFQGAKSDQNQMIGNAVPVRLAQYVANALLTYLSGK